MLLNKIKKNSAKFYALNALLNGEHITKVDLYKHTKIHAMCLAQYVYEFKTQYGLNIKSYYVPRKGKLTAYYMEPEEISRILESEDELNG